MLTEMLNESDTLQNYSKPDQAILMKLAHTFQSGSHYLFMSPEELYESTTLATIQKWQDLLLLQETKNYIKSQMAALAQIAQRKSFMALVNEAMKGSPQANKQVQELSGILNQQDSNRVIVLHRIPRPQEVK